MPFQFVDNNAAIDRAARRRIRSHVAKGRNAGKTLLRPSRKQACGLGINTATALIRIPTVIKGAHDTDINKDLVPEIERQVGDGLSVVSFPEQLTPESKGLVQRAFSFISGPRHAPELSNALDNTCTASKWVRLMFLDEAYFHCAVAMSVMALNNLLIKQEDPKEAMRHLSRTFHLVNERLARNEGVSYNTIAVVVVMAQYERLQGHYQQGIVHVEGLQQMIKLRGGIAQLTRNKPGLAQKIFRADLEYSLHLGAATRFSIEDVANGSTTISGPPSSWRNQNGRKLPKILDSSLFRQLSDDLQNLLMDITYLAWLLNDAGAGHRPKLNDYAFHDTVILLGYRVIHISPLGGPRPTSHLENAIHLGLMAFIITLLRGLDHLTPNIPLLSELAHSATQHQFDSEQQNQEVLLWILFIGRVSVFKEPDEAWLIPKTTRTLHSLGLHTWEDVGRTLVKFPWVSAVHEKAGQALWLRSTSCCKAPAEIALE